MTPTSLCCYCTIQAKEYWQTKCTCMQGIDKRSSRRNAIFQFSRSSQSWAIPFATAYQRCTPCHARCDTTSALHRLGKCTKNADALQGLTKFEDNDTFLESSQTFTLLLHGKKAKHVSSLNELRFILATTTDKAAPLLAPTEDAYEQHA